MRRPDAVCVAIAALLFCTIAVFGQDVLESNVSAEDSATDMPMLLQIQANVQGSLNDLDLDVANASQKSLSN